MSIAAPAFRKFNQFLASSRTTLSLPISVEQLLNFVAFMSLEGATYHTVSLYIAGLSYYHKIRGLTDNTKSFIVSKTLEGFRRTN